MSGERLRAREPASAERAHYAREAGFRIHRETQVSVPVGVCLFHVKHEVHGARNRRSVPGTPFRRVRASLRSGTRWPGHPTGTFVQENADSRAIAGRTGREVPRLPNFWDRDRAANRGTNPRLNGGRNTPIPAGCSVPRSLNRTAPSGGRRAARRDSPRWWPPLAEPVHHLVRQRPGHAGGGRAGPRSHHVHTFTTFQASLFPSSARISSARSSIIKSNFSRRMHLALYGTCGCSRLPRI